jgi:hypothetical protein
MGRSAGLDADQAGGQASQNLQQLVSPNFAAKHGMSFRVDPVKLKDALGDIQAEGGNLHLGGSLPWVTVATPTVFDIRA